MIFGKNNFDFYGIISTGLVMISSLMIVTSLAMLAFPKQLRGNRIPAPHQVDAIDAHKTAPKTDQPEEESVPTLKGGHIEIIFCFTFFKILLV